MAWIGRPSMPILDSGLALVHTDLNFGMQGAKVAPDQVVPAEVVQVELRWGRGRSPARSQNSQDSPRSRPQIGCFQCVRRGYDLLPAEG